MIEISKATAYIAEIEIAGASMGRFVVFAVSKEDAESKAMAYAIDRWPESYDVEIGITEATSDDVIL